MRIKSKSKGDKMIWILKLFNEARKRVELRSIFKILFGNASWNNGFVSIYQYFSEQ